LCGSNKAAEEEEEEVVVENSPLVMKTEQKTCQFTSKEA